MSFGQILGLVFIVAGIIGALIAGALIGDLWKDLERRFPAIAQKRLPIFITCVLIAIVGTLVTAWGSLQSPNSTPAPTAPAKANLCGGVPTLTPNPGGPANFDYQHGYTFYTANNSPLQNDIVRYLFADDSGAWVGYGVSNVGKTGVSHVGNSDENNNRMWEYCADAKGNAFGQIVNGIAKGSDNSIWVATDGQGVWHLKDGGWEQFVYNPAVNNNYPDASTFGIVAKDKTILVGMLSGVVQYNTVTWARILSGKAVHAIAFDPSGNTWIGYNNSGVAQLHPSGTLTEYTMKNSPLTSNNTRSIVVDAKGSVWIATSDGGVNVFENGNWKAYRAASKQILSDSVNALALDRYNRVWAGTTGGVSYFDGTQWIQYSNLDSFSVAFGKALHERCSYNDDDVWIGTNGKGLTNSKLPPASQVFTNAVISGVPAKVKPGEVFKPQVTLTLEMGFNLGVGDFLQSLNDKSYTSNPLVSVPPGVTVEGGIPYTFRFDNNPMTAPLQAGHYTTMWQLWQCGRYVGPVINIDFDVSS